MSIYLKPTLGTIKQTTKEEITVIVKTSHITIIGMYAQPHRMTDDTTERIAEAISRTAADQRVIFAGDLNARIDKLTTKTELIMETLEEAGYNLINKPNMKTYIARNGTSTIDPVVYTEEDISIINKRVLGTSDITPIRKYIPIATMINLGQRVQTLKTRTKKISRKLDTEKLNHNIGKMNKARHLIQQQELTNATEIYTKTLQSCQIQPKERKSRPWSDKDCYNERKKTLLALHRAKSSSQQEDLSQYAQQWKTYKTIIKAKKTKCTEEEARKRVEIAWKDPFIALRKSKPRTTSCIPIETWENHYNNILNNQDHTISRILPQQKQQKTTPP